MTFGDALEELKKGESIQRRGWNGKGMYIYLEKQLSCRIKHEPVIIMLTAQRKLQPGWLASQADMLAEDWVLL